MSSRVLLLNKNVSFGVAVVTKVGHKSVRFLQLHSSPWSSSSSSSSSPPIWQFFFSSNDSRLSPERESARPRWSRRSFKFAWARDYRGTTLEYPGGSDLVGNHSCVTVATTNRFLFRNVPTQVLILLLLH